MSPDALGGVDNELELAPLFVVGQEVAFHGGSKATLRAHAKSLHRNVSGGVPYPLSHEVQWFELRFLCRNKSENNKLILRHVFQWLKGARARIVVFQQ